MLTITINANVPAADAQGIKERIAMDIERHADACDPKGARDVPVAVSGGVTVYGRARALPFSRSP